jgi:Na+-driven multidrug efflux pump
MQIVLNTLPFGIGVAASTRVGQLIGLRSPVGAKNAAHASALLSVIAGAVVMGVMIASRNVSQRPIFIVKFITCIFRHLVSFSAMILMLCSL